jgi:SAM-dependent methyltransferase
VLDLYSGARPYQPLFKAGTRCVGLDVDDAYACADIVSSDLLPFADASFDLCLCTQAFQYVPEPGEAVKELRRVLRAGGEVLLTIQAAFPGDPGPYSRAQLREFFSGWDCVTVNVNGGTTVTAFTYLTVGLHRLEGRIPRRLRLLFGATYWLVNSLGQAVDRIGRRVGLIDGMRPLNLVLRARRPV